MRKSPTKKRTYAFSTFARFQLSLEIELVYCGAMPLSDREKELLAEMERALSADDPRLVSTLTGKGRTPEKKRMVLGIVLVGVGLAILLAGLIIQTIPLGISGFLVSLAGVVIALSNIRAVTVGGMSSAGANQKRKGSWKDRLEERWDRRND